MRGHFHSKQLIGCRSSSRRVRIRRAGEWRTKLGLFSFFLFSFFFSESKGNQMLLLLQNVCNGDAFYLCVSGAFLLGCIWMSRNWRKLRLGVSA